MTEATDDEISNLGSQPRQPAHATEQNGYVYRSEDTPPMSSTRTQSANISSRTDTEDEKSSYANGIMPSNSVASMFNYINLTVIHYCYYYTFNVVYRYICTKKYTCP